MVCLLKLCAVGCSLPIQPEERREGCGGWGSGAQNSIAFSSAPRGEADSQPISQLDRPAVSQTETHTLGFMSVADTGPSSGENNRSQDWQWPNGNAGGHRLFGRQFEPWWGQYGSGAAAGIHRPGFEPLT